MTPSPPRRSGSRRRTELPEVIGRFRRSRQGYGFVRPDDAGPGDREADIRIPAVATGDAADGDTVRVQVTQARDVGRPGLAGEVVEVLERKTVRFVGTAFESAGQGWVQIDGTQFPRAVWVGDPGAKSARDGDKVVVELIRFPTVLRDGEGVIVEVLGAAGTAGVDTRMVIAEFGLPGEFPEAVLEDARRQAAAFSDAVPAGRRDLSAETIVTIDPADARDFDDAISLARIDRGHWLLGVHIADVAHFVREGSPLDQEAVARGTSVYLPDRVIPMLPEIVSNNLASLQPGRVRLARTCWIEFSAEGIPIHAEVERTAITSKRRFSYEEVDRFLADPDTTAVKMTAAVRGLLGRMRDLARLLRGRRIGRGALELNMPEVKVDLDRSGRVSGAHVVVNTESHQIIEEFMLAANEAVAGLLAGAEAGFLRRIHPAPDLRKLRQLTEFVSELGFEVDSLESRFELQRLLDLARGRPEEHAVHYAVLRSLSRAVYGPQADGHYALASDCYCHFTSPIRRYPDLTIHRAIDLLATGKRPPREGLDQLGEQCSQLERRAEAAERELVKLKLLHFLAGRVGSELEGVVTGVERFGLFVQGIELPAEGLVAVERLPEDRYRYDRRAHTLTGHRPGNAFRLGDRVRVRVDAVDLDKRLLEFSLESRPTGRGRKGQAGGRRPATGRGQSRERREKRSAAAEPMRLKVFGAAEGTSKSPGRQPKKKAAKKRATTKKRTKKQSDRRQGR